MISFGKKKRNIPFAGLFQAASPKDFVAIFNSELAQTMAFILSFSPKKKYVQKVMRLLDAQETYKTNSTQKSSFIIREYLNQCQEDAFSLAFVQDVEKEIEGVIEGYENIHYLRNIRKPFLIKRPSGAQKFLKAEKKTSEKSTKEKQRE
jgi:hypothetical protein